MRTGTLRRSFASASRAAPFARLGLIGLLALLLATFAPDLRSQGSPVLVGTVTKVIDGDTIDVKLTSGTIRVRFHAIDTPERAQPGGREATAALASLVAGKQVELEPFEQDAYYRLVARVFVDGNDVNGALVQQGHAWAYRQYMTRDDAAYCVFEHEARTQRRGLWALPPVQRVAPWEWRKHGAALTDYGRETAASCGAAIGGSVNIPAFNPLQRRLGWVGETSASERFACDTKTYCSEMVSCDEARFYLAKCGLTRLDGDSDGVPCEALCR